MRKWRKTSDMPALQLVCRQQASRGRCVVSVTGRRAARLSRAKTSARITTVRKCHLNHARKVFRYTNQKAIFLQRVVNGLQAANYVFHSLLLCRKAEINWIVGGLSCLTIKYHLRENELLEEASPTARIYPSALERRKSCTGCTTCYD